MSEKNSRKLIPAKINSLKVHRKFCKDIIKDDLPVFLGVCQVMEVREVREKSGNSLYALKSQGKIREFSEKSRNFSEIKKSSF